MLSLPAMADDVSLGKTLSKIRDRGYFYVGYRASASPFSYQLAAADGQSAVAGYTWEICGHVVKAVEDAVGKPFKVVPVPVSE
jgi:glutamate/aspartate transport system substrate-binding protein